MLQPHMQSIKKKKRKKTFRCAIDAENIRVVPLSRDTIALVFFHIFQFILQTLFDFMKMNGFSMKTH